MDSVSAVPTADMAALAARQATGLPPRHVRRFPTGAAHFVFEAIAREATVVVRMGRPEQSVAMAKGTALVRRLGSLGVRLPAILAEGRIAAFPYTVMERLPGDDLGTVVDGLDDERLREVAERVAEAQAITGRLGQQTRYGYAAEPGEAPFRRWSDVVMQNLERSRRRIPAAGLFDPRPVEAAMELLDELRPELDAQPAVPFLHDTTTRNVLVHRGCFSGIVDVDDLCFGDPRYTPALTLAALAAHRGPHHYVDHWLQAAGHADDRLFRFYAVVFLLDLAGEHGQVFNGNETPSTAEARAGLLRELDTAWARLATSPL